MVRNFAKPAAPPQSYPLDVATQRVYQGLRKIEPKENSRKEQQKRTAEKTQKKDPRKNIMTHRTVKAIDRRNAEPK